jgi:hypothetical protein
MRKNVESSASILRKKNAIETLGPNEILRL